MERIQNTDMPYSSLMGIRQNLRYDDNSTNVKLQSKKTLEGLNGMMLERQQSIQRARMIREDINNNLITKLKKVLSKKFNLNRDDYIVLIDKFNLKNSNLNRQTIIKMINSLNEQHKYSDDTIKYMNTKGPNKNITIGNNNNYNKIILNECEEDDFKDDSKEKSFDDRLQELISSRMPSDNKTKPNLNNTVSNKSNDNPKINTISKQNSYANRQLDNYDIEKPVNTMGEQIYFPPPNRDTNKKPNDNQSPGLNTISTSIPPSHVRNSIPTHTQSKQSIPIQMPKLEQPRLIINDITQPNNLNNTQNNDKIESSLLKILDTIKPAEDKPVEKEYECNIMANIIQSNSKNNEVCDSFQFDVNYNGNQTISNIKRVELVSCFINENFYRKNEFKNSPWFFIKIKEFTDILYINGSSGGVFCQIMWEKKGNFYNYINNDKLFGVYVPTEKIVLDKLTIELYDHNGGILKELKSTEADQFNVVLKIITDKPL